MSRRVCVAVKSADIVKFEADVIALKYQGHLSGATQQVARALGISAARLAEALPSERMIHVAPGEGRIGAGHAVFLRVAPASSFTYQDVRLFNADVLRALVDHLPDARHLAVPTHGVGFDSDLEDSLTAIIRGCGDAIREGDIPKRLDTVTILDRRFEHSASLRRLLSDLVPEGGLPAPGEMPDDPPEPTVAPPVDKPSLYDIFISFKSEDAAIASQVHDILSKNGLRVFFSRKSLPALGSTEYHKQIDRALEHARHMVVVTTSPEHVSARWVQYEWRTFMSEQLSGRKTGNVITVLGGAMEISDLPISLRQFEVLRCDDDGLERLIEFTRHDVDLKGADEARPASGRAIQPKPKPPAADDTAVTVGDALIVATRDVLWNTSWKDALEHLLLSPRVDLSKGWRMPTLDELRLIRSHSVLPEDSCYWSSEEAGTKEARYVHFDDGHVGQGPKSFSHGVSAVFVKSQPTPRS